MTVFYVMRESLVEGTFYELQVTVLNLDARRSFSRINVGGLNNYFGTNTSFFIIYSRRDGCKITKLLVGTA